MNIFRIVLLSLISLVVFVEANDSTVTDAASTTAIDIDNQNVTEDSSVSSTEMPSMTSSNNNFSENQLKVSNMITNIPLTLSIDAVSTLPAIVSTLETLNSHPTSHKNDDNEDNVEKTPEISFGIRSFTVEVSKNIDDEKVLSTTTTTPTSTTSKTSPTTITPENSKFSDVSTKTTETLSPHRDNLYQSTSPSINVLKSNLNILFNNNNNDNDDDDGDVTADTILLNEHENEISNEIQIDKKLDNGLYRIKIGEITTDEFNTHHEQSKVNIDDFFPSKIEDFRPIIELSNAKMLREHGEQSVKPEPALTSEVSIAAEKSTTGTRINTSNVATTNIEIELIDDTTTSIDSSSSQSGNEKLIDSAPLSDELVTEAPTRKINSDSNVFIPKRTKKFDPSMNLNTQGPTRIHDFGMTKFNQKKVNQSSVNGKPEFSTTKFYNSKELYNEILHKTPKINIVTTNQSFTTTSTNVVREKLLNTNKIPSEASHSIAMATTVEPITTSTSGATLTEQPFIIPTSRPRMLSRLEEKLNSLDCDIQNLSADSTVWRGNETHELNLPITVSNFHSFILFCFFLWLNTHIRGMLNYRFSCNIVFVLIHTKMTFSHPFYVSTILVET
jgi:hypothetical protein